MKRAKNKYENQASLWRFIRPDYKMLIFLTCAGVIFNIGLVFIPIFEGWLAQYLFDIIGGTKVFLDMLKLVIAYVFVMLIVQFSRYLKRILVRKLANNMIVRMRDALYDNILKRPKRELDDSVGELVTRAAQDVEIVAEGTRKTVTEIFDTGVLLISFSVTLFIYDPKIAAIALLFTPIACIIAELLKKLIYSQTYAYKTSAEKLANATYDRVNAAQLFRVYGRDAEMNNYYDEYLKDYESKAIKSSIWENTLQPVYNVIAMIGVIFIIYLGGRNFLGIGFRLWDIAAFTTFIACYAKIADKSSKVAKLFNSVQKAQVSWKRLKKYVYVEAGNFENQDVVSSNGTVYVEVNDLGFSYNNEVEIFENVSFTAKSGEIIGITGAIASGKSTLGKVFLNEFPYSGSIKINGKELSTLDEEELYNYISYQGHNPELFSDSVKENICMGNDCNVEEYLKDVCLDKEIEQTGDGDLTEIGGLGVRLSGGQQARLALARTLYHAKSILILDDPFSAVDKATEAIILKQLKSKYGDRLILIISHRLTAFPNFDKVLWLSDKTVVCSNHNELMQNNLAYRNLYELQTEATND